MVARDSPNHEFDSLDIITLSLECETFSAMGQTQCPRFPKPLKKRQDILQHPTTMFQHLDSPPARNRLVPAVEGHNNCNQKILSYGKAIILEKNKSKNKYNKKSKSKRSSGKVQKQGQKNSKTNITKHVKQNKSDKKS